MATTPQLTERQRKIMDLIAAGRTTPQIAEALGINQRTIKWYVDGLRTLYRVKYKRDLIPVARELEAKRRRSRKRMGERP